MIAFLFAVLLLATLQCLAFSPAPPIISQNGVNNNAVDSHHTANLTFLCYGDWGLPERLGASQMAKIAEEADIDFILAIGDNFYENGVANVTDPQWQTTYEDIFTEEIYNKRWYVVEGNHDHHQNTTAQIEYSKKSDRWYLPALWYNEVMTIPETNVTAEFVFIDTVVLAGDWLEEAEQPSGPRSVQAAAEQWQWIEETLAKSTADWLFVVGHYPVYSIGEHGSTKLLVERLQPLLSQYGVAAYFDGHDHGLQHTNYEGVNYFVTGNGAKSAVQTVQPDKVPPGALLFAYPADSAEEKICEGATGEKCWGFGLAVLRQTKFTMTLYASNWNVELYSTEFTNPRAEWKKDE